MKKQAIETLIEQLENLKQNITNNETSEQQAVLLASLKFVAEYIKHMNHNNKCAEVQIAHALIDALIDVNTQEMNFPEWIAFSAYLHDLSLLLETHYFSGGRKQPFC